jgi:hypothetical protein
MNIEHIGKILVIITDVFVNAVDRADANEKSSFFMLPFFVIPSLFQPGEGRREAAWLRSPFVYSSPHRRESVGLGRLVISFYLFFPLH